MNTYIVVYVLKASSKLPEKDAIDVMAHDETDAWEVAKKELKKQGVKHAKLERVQLRFKGFVKREGLELNIRQLNRLVNDDDGIVYTITAVLNGFLFTTMTRDSKEVIMRRFGLTAAQFEDLEHSN